MFFFPLPSQEICASPLTSQKMYSSHQQVKIVSLSNPKSKHVSFSTTKATKITPLHHHVKICNISLFIPKSKNVSLSIPKSQRLSLSYPNSKLVSFPTSTCKILFTKVNDFIPLRPCLDSCINWVPYWKYAVLIGFASATITYTLQTLVKSIILPHRLVKGQAALPLFICQPCLFQFSNKFNLSERPSHKPCLILVANQYHSFHGLLATDFVTLVKTPIFLHPCSKPCSLWSSIKKYRASPTLGVPMLNQREINWETKAISQYILL